MKRMRTGAGLFTFAIMALVVALIRDESPEGVAEAQPKAPAGPVVMPARIDGVLLTFGLKDQTATDWNGTVTLSEGKLLSLDVAEANPAATATGNSFKTKTVLGK